MTRIKNKQMTIASKTKAFLGLKESKSWLERKPDTMVNHNCKTKDKRVTITERKANHNRRTNTKKITITERNANHNRKKKDMRITMYHGLKGESQTQANYYC